MPNTACQVLPARGLLRDRLRRLGAALLSSRGFPLFAAALAALIALPSLTAGLHFDDYHLKLLMQGAPRHVRLLDHPLDMFRLLNGDLERMRALRDYGFVPWWGDLSIKGAFWRPLTSATHWLDYLLWPAHPALMHAQSITWYALLAAAVSCLYRRIMGPAAVAGLAALLYVIDDAHSVPVGFLSNRNAILAALLGVLALSAHVRWRNAGWRPGAWAGPALLALSLLAKEEGVATCAYLAAFALILDRHDLRSRLVSLVPYVAVVVVWRLAWVGLGYGVSGVSLYVDPLREPLGFASAVPQHAPVLLLAQLAAPPADLTILFEGRWLQAFCVLAAVGLIGLLLLMMPVLRGSRTARFWFAGMVLAVVPMCATFPADRMLLFPGLGGMALLAEFFTRLWGDRPPGLRRVTVAVGVLLVLVHGLVAPLNFMARAAAPIGPRALQARLYLDQPLDAEVASQDLVFVNPPLGFALLATPLIWASERAPLPRHLRVLTASGFQPVEVTRPDEYTLVIRPAAGYLSSKMDRLCRRDDRPLAPGAQIALPGMAVTVLAVDAHQRPAEASFRFDVPLEDPSLRWLQWRAGQYEPFVLPAVGSSVVLPASWWDLF
ncbi:MAG: hypothetical protein AB1716_06390 [Planctomycetota bacterium]